MLKTEYRALKTADDHRRYWKNRARTVNLHAQTPTHRMVKIDDSFVPLAPSEVMVKMTDARRQDMRELIPSLALRSGGGDFIRYWGLDEGLGYPGLPTWEYKDGEYRIINT